MLRASLRACSRLLAPRVPPFSSAGSARGLCTVHAKAPPPASPRLYQLPPLSSRKQRLQQQGLVGLSAESVRMEQGPKRATEDSFRVQNYNVTLKKPAEFALTAVYGYGRSRSKQLAASVTLPLTLTSTLTLTPTLTPTRTLPLPLTRSASSGTTRSTGCASRSGSTSGTGVRVGG